MKTIKGPQEIATIALLKKKMDESNVVEKAAQYWREMGHTRRESCCATLSSLTKAGVLERVGRGAYRVVKEGETPTLPKAPVPSLPPLPPKDDRIFLTKKEKSAFDRLGTVNKQSASGDSRAAGDEFLSSFDEEEEKNFTAKMRSHQVLGGAIGNGEKGKIFPFNAEAYLHAIDKVVVTTAASLPQLIQSAEAELQTLLQIVRETKKRRDNSRKQLAKMEATLENSKQKLALLEQEAVELRKNIATLAAEIEKNRRETEQLDPRLADPQRSLAQVKGRLAMLRGLAKMPEEDRARFLYDLQQK